MVDISDNGAVDFRLNGGTYLVTGNGALSNSRGAGKWASPTFHCTGRWRVERQ
jgi:hypothetical protein